MKLLPVFYAPDEFEIKIQMAPPQHARELPALQGAIQTRGLAPARKAFPAFGQDVATQRESDAQFAPASQTGHDF
jgi:hypothetical protein